MNKLKITGLSAALLALCPCFVSGQIVANSTQGTLGPTYTTFPSVVGINIFADSNGAAGGGAPASTGTVNTTLQGFGFTSPGASPIGLGINSPIPVQLFCIQIEEFTSHPEPVTFEYVGQSLLDRPSSFGIDDSAAATRESQLSQLFTAVFGGGYNPTTIGATPGKAWTGADNGNAALAFQLAVWNVIYGGGLHSLVTDSVTDASAFFRVTSSSTVTTIADQMLYAANSALASVTLYALQNLGNPGAQDFVIPVYNDTPGQTTPEPATYALLVGVATLGVVSIRRRFKASA
ncbi:MAG: PEP-CTERM sorting domain-containing protein [Opitutaceae bacterium]